MEKKGMENVRRGYVQSVLSGFSGISEQTYKDGDNAEGRPPRQPQSPYFWQQKSYLILIPVIVTETSVSDNQFQYSVRVALDVDVPISPYKPASKNLSGQVFSMAKEKQRDKSAIPMVYGISERGVNPLSPTLNTPLSEALSHTYGRTMGLLNRAIECIIQFSGKASKGKGNVDPGERKESTLSPQDLGKPENARGGKKIRNEVLPKGQAKDPSVLVEAHR